MARKSHRKNLHCSAEPGRRGIGIVYQAQELDLERSDAEGESYRIAVTFSKTHFPYAIPLILTGLLPSI